MAQRLCYLWTFSHAKPDLNNANEIIPRSMLILLTLIFHEAAMDCMFQLCIEHKSVKSKIP